MRNISKVLCLFLLFSLMTISGFARGEKTVFPDSIRMQMPNGTTIECMNLYDGRNDLTGQILVKQHLTDFLKRWSVLKMNGVSNQQSMLIVCDAKQEYFKDYENTITIKHVPYKAVLSFPMDKALALAKKGQHRVEFLDQNYTLAINFDSIEQLEELISYNFDQILKNTDAQLHTTENAYLNNNPFIAWIEVKADNSAKLLHKRQITDIATNNIWISGGTFLENVKGNWNGGFYANMTFELGDKLMPKDAFSMEYEFMYDFSSTNNPNINHWMSLGYARNLSKNPNKTNWLGLSLGYLVKQEGDLFEKDSFKLGVNKRLSKNISIVPQMYFNDFFKNVTPGLKLRINL